MLRLPRPALIAIALLLFAILAAATGCNTEQRIETAQQVMDRLEQQEQRIDQSIQRMEQDLATAEQQLEAAATQPSSSPETTRQLKRFVEQMQQRLAQAEGIKADLEGRLGQWSEKLDKLEADKATLSDELKLAGEGLQSVSGALPPPFNSVGYLVGTLLTIGGVGFGAHQRKGKKQAERVGRNLVSSVDEVLKSRDKEDATGIRAMLRNGQTKDTADFVREAKGK